jgi:hypothetical protein
MGVAITAPVPEAVGDAALRVDARSTTLTLGSLPDLGAP